MDRDGYGDNLGGNNPDIFPQNPTQWNDTDGDGYGDNANGIDPDKFPLMHPNGMIQMEMDMEII